MSLFLETGNATNASAPTVVWCHGCMKWQNCHSNAIMGGLERGVNRLESE
jgi:hypothetical protein